MSYSNRSNKLPTEEEATNESIFKYLEILRSVHNEKALRILLALDELGHANVKRLTSKTRLSQPEVSMALAKMRAAKTVTFQRTGKEIDYWIGSSFAKEIIDSLRAQIDRLLERDDNPLRKMT